MLIKFIFFKNQKWNFVPAAAAGRPSSRLAGRRRSSGPVGTGGTGPGGHSRTAPAPAGPPPRDRLAPASAMVAAGTNTNNVGVYYSLSWIPRCIKCFLSCLNDWMNIEDI